MYSTISKQTRPNGTVNFWIAQISLDQAVIAYFDATYGQTGKWLGSDYQEMSSGLVLMSTQYWINESAFVDEFSKDPYIIDNFLGARATYVADHNITLEILVGSA